MLQTGRLDIIPLTLPQLGLWLDDLDALEAELACRYRAQPLDSAFGEVVRVQMETARSDGGNHLFYTFWLLLRREDRAVVGSAVFKGPPGEGGEVEVGYGLGDGFGGRGYMTEAVRALCAWALEQPGVRAVTAETNPDSAASQNVLKRCGFTLYADGGTHWYRLAK